MERIFDPVWITVDNFPRSSYVRNGDLLQEIIGVSVMLGLWRLGNLYILSR